MKDAHSWLGSVSDMMSGLMMIFLLIAVAFMLEVQRDKQRIENEKQWAVESALKAASAEREALQSAKKAEKAEKEAELRASSYLQQGETIRKIAATYSELQIGLYQDLLKEFRDDLPKWNATIESDNTVRFNEPEVLFETGKSALRDRFKVILSDFFPRYVGILTGAKYIGNIEEVRVEGHTSSEWENATSITDRYLNNARLSQERALAVVQYAYLLQSTANQRDWLTKALRANGLSFARPILNHQGAEDQGRSRRVEFRVFTKTKEQILRIIEVSEKQQQEQR
jgi:outer membrane protein OmpA-like peptidoglycan-associated protein